MDFCTDFNEVYLKAIKRELDKKNIKYDEVTKKSLKFINVSDRQVGTDILHILLGNPDYVFISCCPCDAFGAAERYPVLDKLSELNMTYKYVKGMVNKKGLVCLANDFRLNGSPEEAAELFMDMLDRSADIMQDYCDAINKLIASKDGKESEVDFCFDMFKNNDDED